MTAGELARKSGLTTGAVTAVLDRLERAGYARRLRDAADRRRVLAEPTEQTRRVAAELYGELGKEVATALQRYGRQELALIRDFLRLDRELKEKQLARIRARTAAIGASGSLPGPATASAASDRRSGHAR